MDKLKEHLGSRIAYGDEGRFIETALTLLAEAEEDMAKSYRATMDSFELKDGEMQRLREQLATLRQQVLDWTDKWHNLTTWYPPKWDKTKAVNEVEYAHKLAKEMREAVQNG